MLVIRAGTHKMLVGKGNSEDPDQTASQKQSDLGLLCLSRLSDVQLTFRVLKHLP